MSQIKEKIGEKLNQITEGKYFENSNILPVIKKLAETEWSRGKRSKMEASRLMSLCAESDEYIAHKFMKEMDKASTEHGTKIIKKLEEGFFKPRTPLQKNAKLKLEDSDKLKDNK